MKAKGDISNKICVVVGTITNDLRLYEVPALKVCCKSVLSLLALHQSLVNYSFSQTVCETENQMSSLFELNCKP